MGTQLDWSFINVTTSTLFKSKVQNCSYTTGRPSAIDQWNPGQLSITITNTSDEAAGFTINDKIRIRLEQQDFPNDYYHTFYVQEVSFNDQPGNQNGSTATIICTDVLGRLGRTNVFTKNMPQAKTITQLTTAFSSDLPANATMPATYTGTSTASVNASYTGTVANRINLNMVTEQGILWQNQTQILLIGRDDIAALATSTISLGPESPYYTYTNIKRIALGTDFLNSCTVSTEVTAAVNSTDATSVSTYGTYGGTLSTVDYDLTQATGSAAWQVFSRSDPTSIVFSIDMTSANSSNCADVIKRLWKASPELFCFVFYRKPGSPNLIQYLCQFQGFSMYITPALTTFTFSLAPASFTGVFTLNSNVFGILDQNILSFSW